MMRNIDHLRQLYPHLRFAKHWEAGPGVQYKLGQCDGIVQAIGGAPILPDFQQDLLLMSLRKGAQATTAIEGNTLSDEEVERLAPGARPDEPQEYEEREVQNVLDTFNSLLDEVIRNRQAEQITPELMLRLHRMIGQNLGERFHAIPGQFAQSQRVVGTLYRAPGAQDVPGLVSALCEWLATEFRYPNQRFADAVIEAVVAHVYIEWIHPFDDGNGRLGRTMEFYMLARGGLPAIASHLLSNHYNQTRAEYYRQLQRARLDNNLSAFLDYAITGLRDGLQETLTMVHENAWTQLWRVAVHDAFEGQGGRRGPALKRQRRLALALPLGRAVPLEELPKLSQEIEKEYAAVGMRTIFRDVQQLERLNLITRERGIVRARRASLEYARPERRRNLRPTT
jgi:Fic family protein